MSTLRRPTCVSSSLNNVVSRPKQLLTGFAATPSPASEHGVVAQRRPHVGEPADRVHPVARQPDDRARVTDASERLSGVAQDRVGVEVQVQPRRAGVPLRGRLHGADDGSIESDAFIGNQYRPAPMTKQSAISRLT